VAAASPAVALTGAGISAECGVPPFRGPGGLWDRYPPDEYATAEAFAADPAKVWVMLAEIIDKGVKVEPGEGHRALARMEEIGALAGVVTQNVDGLHQEAGSRTVVEFHGTGAVLYCVDCGVRISAREADLTVKPPTCLGCGGVLRPDAVLFGEPIPPAASLAAHQLVAGCGSLLVVGTSCEVFPASMLPAMARGAGASVIEINPFPTALTPAADISLRGKAGEVLPELLERLE